MKQATIHGATRSAMLALGSGNGGASVPGISAADEQAIADHCGCDVSQMRHLAAGSLYYLSAILKSGNINQGYAQCYVDQLQKDVEAGKCSPERIQCRQPATLAADGVPGGGAVTFSITPVGHAYLREWLTVFEAEDDPASPDIDFQVTAITSLGVQSLTGRVTATGTGGLARTGYPLAGFGADFQNYVVPTGVVFDSSNALEVTITNLGADLGSFRVMTTYDQVRQG